MRIPQLASFGQRWRISSLWLGAGLCLMALVWFLTQQPRLGSLLVLGVIALLLGFVLFFRQDGTLSFRRVLVPLLAVAILSPYIRLPAGIPDVRPELLIVLATWALLFLSHLATGHPIQIRRCPAYKWFILFGLCILVSMTYGALMKGQPVIWQDFWELAKVLLYLLTLTLVASVRIDSARMKRYYSLALVVLLFSALFGFAQYIDFLSITTVVSPYYAPTQMEGLLVLGRVTGTTPNPNEFGALMVLAASLALSGGLFLQKRRLRLLSWGTLPIFGLALVFTLSRSSLVALLLAALVVLFLFLRRKDVKHRVRRVIALLLLGYVVGLAVLPLVPGKALFRFSQLATFTETTSWQMRVENWKINFAIWEESPLLGWGPGKATMGTIVDNEWLLVLRRYGAVGVAVFLSLFGSLFLGLSRIRRFNSDAAVVALTVALQGTLVGYVLYMGVAAIYHSLQLMPILLIFLGLAYSQSQPSRSMQESPKP